MIKTPSHNDSDQPDDGYVSNGNDIVVRGCKALTKNRVANDLNDVIERIVSVNEIVPVLFVTKPALDQIWVASRAVDF